MDGHLILGTCLFQINRIVASLYFAVYLNIFKIKKKKEPVFKKYDGLGKGKTYEWRTPYIRVQSCEMENPEHPMRESQREDRGAWCMEDGPWSNPEG